MIKGRVWKVERDGKLIDDIDTDMIYHNKYLHIVDRKEMAKYAFSNLEGWKDFPEKARKGDVLIVGENFGCGSSRQHAVDCFISLGIAAIIGKSFGAIYKRNAINSGLAILECKDIDKADIKTGDEIEINIETGEIFKNGVVVAKAKPMSKIQLEIYKAGNLFEYAKKMK
ncbi:MAG: 3-isopropylmalate dehydratase [Thermoplasmata archaeon]|nr:MAG: 3-isopropylmalate dehydratase [Thermoplasmata archaeon]MCD6223115.1 3-isopropylmalate dehydratase [Thermoplasmata archaeon]